MLKVFIFLLLTTCGGYDDRYGSEEPSKPDSEKFKAVKAVIDRECGRCHNGSIQRAFNNEQRWLSSAAKQRINDASMPPDKRLSDSDRAKLLSSF